MLVAQRWKQQQQQKYIEKKVAVIYARALAIISNNIVAC